LLYRKRNRTSVKDIGYSLYLYFLGLSYRNTAKALSKRFIKRSHVSIWKWVQHYRPEKIFYNRRKISEFIVDETQIKIGKDYFWIWVALESDNKTIVGIHLSLERNMLVAEQFLQNIIKKYGKHPVSSDGGTWYIPACKLLKLKHHINSSYQKSIIERIIQYIKDRTENFDDYFPCNKNKCKLKHVVNWFHQFVDYYNKEVICLS
jgi:putative transposase